MVVKNVSQKVCVFFVIAMLGAGLLQGAKGSECTGPVGFKHNMNCPFGFEHKTRLRWLNVPGVSSDILLTVGCYDDDGDTGQAMVFFTYSDAESAVCSNRGCPGQDPICQETECGPSVGFITTVQINGSQEDFDTFFPNGISAPGACTITKVGQKYPVVINKYEPPSLIATPSNGQFKPLGYTAKFDVLVETVYLYYEGCIADKQVDQGTIRIKVVQYVPEDAWMTDYRKRRPDPPHLRHFTRVFAPVGQADIDWIEFEWGPSDWPCGGNCIPERSMITPISYQYAAASYHAVRIPSMDSTAPNTIAAAMARWGWQTNHDPAYIVRDMGSAGKLYYNCDTTSSETGKKLASNIEYCTSSQSRGQGSILWRFDYDANDRMTAMYDGPVAGSSDHKYLFGWSHNQTTGADTVVISYVEHGQTIRQLQKQYNRENFLTAWIGDSGTGATEYYGVADYNDHRLEGVEKKIYNAVGDIVRFDVYDVNKLTDELYERMDQPVLVSSYAVKNPGGGAQTSKFRDFVYDPNNAVKTEYTWLSNDSARCVKYYYTDASLKNLIKKVEYSQLATGLWEPSGQTFTTIYNYDDVNNIKEVLYPSGKRADVTVYDTDKRIISSCVYDIEHDANAGAVSTFYSGNNVSSRIDQHGGETEYEYTTINGSTFLSIERGPVCDGNRQVKQYLYDGAGRVIEEIAKDPNGVNVSTKFIYDPITGRLDSKIQAYGRGEQATTIYKYDDLGKVTRIKSAAGVVTGKSYNVLGQLADEFVLAEATDINEPDASLELISQTKYIYDANGHVVTQKRAKDGTAFTFDEPADWITTQYGYDFLGRKTSETADVNGLELTTTYEYDNQGELVKTTYPDGKWEKIVRDGRGLVTERITGYGSTNVLVTACQYDLNGNLTQQQNPDGTVDVFAYDNFDRLIRKYKQSTGGAYTQFDLNEAGQALREAACDANDVVLKEIRKQYDPLGMVITERTLEVPGTLNDANDSITIFKYDVAGNLVKTVSKGPGSVNPAVINEPNDIIGETGFDAMNRRVRLIDGEGLETSMMYDGDGRITASIDANGFAVSKIYDSAGRLVKTIDEMGNYKTNLIDSLDRVIKTTSYDCNGTPTLNDDVALEQVRFEYDNLGNMIRRATMRDGASNAEIDTTVDKVEDFIYDENTGRLYQEKTYYNSNQTAITTHYYDGIGRQVRVVDAEGNEKKTYFDTVYPGRITRTEEINYNQAGSAGSVTVGTVYGYDGQGRLASATIEKTGTDIVTSYSYDAMGRCTSITKPNGAIDVNTYGAMGNIISMVRDRDDVGQRVDFEFDRLGRKIGQIAYDPAGQKTQYIYTRNGKISDIIYADASAKNYYYDLCGEVDEIVNRDGKSVLQSRDRTGRLLEETDSLTAPTFRTEFDYDGAGRMIWAKKTAGGITVSESSFTYNGFGLKQSETVTYDDDSNTTVIMNYQWDQAGNLVMAWDGLTGNQFTYTHDGLGRVKTVSLGQTQLAQYQYIGSQVKSIEYTNAGIATTLAFDELMRTQQITSLMSSETLLDLVYTHDDMSNIISMQYNHLLPAVYDLYTYDRLGRLTAAQYASETGLSRIFEIGKIELAAAIGASWFAGNDIAAVVALSVSDANEPNDASTIENVYDDQGNLSAKIITDAQGKIISFTIYLDDGGRVTINSTYDGDSQTDVVEQYNAAGQLVSSEIIQQQPTAPETLIMTGFSEEPMMSFMNFEDDFLMQSMSMSSPTPGSEEFGCDSLGNRLATYNQNGTVVTYQHNSLNQYTNIETDYGWGIIEDANLSYDQSGNLQLDACQYGYEYDYAGRLAKIKSGTIVLVSYEYDALGRRIKTVKDGLGQYFYYDTQGRVVAETVVANNVIDLARSYAYGQGEAPITMLFKEPYVDANEVAWLIGFCGSWLCDSNNPSYDGQYDEDDSNSVDLEDFASHINSDGWHSNLSDSTETQYYYLYDQAASVMALIGGKYGRAEDREYYVYDAFGIPSTQSEIGNDFFYNSMRLEQIDSVTIFEKDGRHYSPVLGRWMQPREEGPNAYEFAGSNPITAY
ncbi:MAG: hypothetical protein A2Y07_11830 [Planctomycetes bacterium GWF2_50_10]|nr:MAG: hypothetical protein A2Y07_11830 [Planctomycetes bacterium GWF2_50_10]